VNSAYHILYVDDESTLLEIGKLFLEQSGQFVVEITSSAQEALIMLNSKTYDAVISDYQMPGMHGIEFLTKVRNSGNTIPFILFTGRGREEVVIQALNEGADFYLQKGGEPKSQFIELEHQVFQAIQQRRAEASIRDLEQREANIISFLPDPTLVIDTNGVVIAWNRAMEEMTGVPASAILGKGDYEYAIPFYGQRQPVLIDLVVESNEEIARNYAHITHKKDILIAETSLPRLKGKPVTLMGIASPLYDRQGNIVGAIESIRDITERKHAEDALKESEEKYRTLVENVIDVVYRADSAGKIIFITPSALPLTGYDNLNDILGHPIVSFWAYPEKRNDMIARMKESGYVKDYEVIILKRDGTGLPVSISSHFYYDRNGRIAGVEGIIRDISERKKAEDELCESEGRFAAFMDHLPVTAFIKDEQSTNLFVNRHMIEVFGEQEWIGKSVYKQFPLEAAEKMIADDQQTLREGYRRNMEYLIDRKGDKKIFETYKFRIDRGNKPPLIGGFAVDITEQKRKEQELQENEQRLASIYNTVEDSIFQIAVEPGGQYRFTSVNAAFSRTTGVSPEHVIGRRVNEIIPEPSLSLVLEKYRQAVEKKVIVRWEETSDYPTGRLTGEVCIAPIVDKAGTCTHLIGSVHDITERKKAEEALRKRETEFRDFFNTTGDAIVIHDLQGRFLEVNDEICRRLGYTREEMLKMTPGDIDEPEYGEKVRDRIKTLEQTGHIVFETVHWRKDGSRIPTEVNSRVITYHGEPAIISTGRDISERKSAEDALRLTNKKLKILSGITRHDIKNQLMSLNGFLEISKKYPGDAAKMSEFIGKEEKILKFLERQIAFTKEYEAIGVDAPVWQDWRTLVETAVTEAPLGTVLVKNDLPTGFEVFADPLIGKVCYNLMDNAVHHGGKITTIRFFMKERDGDQIVVCADDGIGVPAEEKEQIFGLGFGKNTGMGLFLVREILAITGITIIENGEPGKGARFEMTVPKGAYRSVHT